MYVLCIAFSYLSGQPPFLIWILGHSFVLWGALHADVRPDGLQFGFARDEVIIRSFSEAWHGLEFSLSELDPFAHLDRAPDVLVLHVGEMI